ncbi:MAG TPA: hypothetical protein VNL71_22420, partial [Chloroflexota bacterium]|nr:hypothetical protein [Chloroflexota bacterium]
AIWTYPLTQARLSVFHYLTNFAWPFNMRLMPVEPTANSLQAPGVLIGIAFIVGTLIGARLLRRASPLLAFCILGYWIAQSAESSIVPMLHNAVDYRPSPASPFLFLAVALGLERRGKPVLVSLALLALIAFFSAASLHMNAGW